MDLVRASDFRAINNEANFGPPIEVEVVGGAHIAFEFITKAGHTFFMTRWPQGLPRHDDPPHALRFPHGLIVFGETVLDCAKRLVREQQGFEVNRVHVLDIDSYVDEKDHWHIEPICLAEVTGNPIVPPQASEVINFTVDNLPDMTFWTHEEFRDIVTPFLASRDR